MSEPEQIWISAIGEPMNGHVDHLMTWYAISTAASEAKAEIEGRGQHLSLAAWLGSGRPLPDNPPDPGPGDTGRANRIALFYPYEMTMLHFDPSGNACTLTESVPLIASFFAQQADPTLIDV
jgi:hypothetical protein